MLSDSELGVAPGTKVTASSPLSRLSRPFATSSTAPLSTYSSTEFPRIELRGSVLDVGIFRDTLLPSLTLNAGVSLIAYGVARSTNRVEIKDYIWPLAPVLNVWWSSVGRRVVFRGDNAITVLSRLSRPEKLLLGGVTVWGSRLLYRIISRSIARRNETGATDDERYEQDKKEEGFWNSALGKLFLPEVIAQTLISLPFTAPFRHQGGVFTGYHPIMQAVSVGLFFTGMALEAIGDAQLETFKRTKGGNQVCKEGVWSIVRHPNYLGDALIHFSFPLLLFSSDMLAPIEILGPIVNYVFLRHVGGVRQTEESQADRYVGVKKAELERYQVEPNVNAFWPHWEQVKNKWTWIVIGAGAVGAAIEQVIHLSGLD